MTESNQDPEEWREFVGGKRRRDEMAKKFKDDGDPLKIAIVVDMWLTGFDVPSLATMYVYKPMAGHNLMQAIARVNRVYRDKEGGLAVDYVGIAGALKQAMNDYTNRDKQNYGEQDIAKTALPKFIEKLEVCRRTNLVKSEKFSEMLSRAMKAYLNGMLSNEEVIAELLKMAKDMATASAEGDAMGLTDEELAFYDALTRPEAIKDLYDNEELVAMTRELTGMLRKNRTIDWQKKQSARAGMRRMVKKLLKKYKYPPEGMEDAIATVIGQCEMWTDNSNAPQTSKLE